MLPAYNLVVTITANENLSETLFRDQVGPSLAYLSALKGALGQGPCSIKYYPPGVQNRIPDAEYWSVEVIVLISLGKQRAEHLMQLYKAIVRLICFELPQFQIQAETNIVRFDNLNTGI